MQNNIVTILALGLSGHGKSEFGNGFLQNNEAFQSSDECDSCTLKTNVKSNLVDSSIRFFIDTQGFQSSDGNDGKYRQDMVTTLNQMNLAINAFFIVINVQNPRVDAQIQNMLNILNDFFNNKDCWERAAIVFTKCYRTNDELFYSPEACEKYRKRIIELVKNFPECQDITIEMPCFFVDSIKWNTDEVTKMEFKKIYDFSNKFKPILNNFSTSILNYEDSFDPIKIQKCIDKIRKEGQNKISMFAFGQNRTFNLDEQGKVKINFKAKLTYIYEYKYDFSATTKSVKNLPIDVSYDFENMKLNVHFKFQIKKFMAIFFKKDPEYIYNELETCLHHWKDRPYFLLFWIVVRYSTRTRYSLEIELEDDFVFKDSMNSKYQINSPNIEIPYPKVGAFLESKKITVPTELFLSMKDYSKNEDNEIVNINEDIINDNDKNIPVDLIDPDDEYTPNEQDNAFKFYNSDLINSFLVASTKVGEGAQSIIHKVDLQKVNNKENLDFGNQQYVAIKMMKKENENNEDDSDFSYDEDDNINTDNDNNNVQIEEEEINDLPINIYQARYFLGEYEVLRELNHPNIIKSYGFFLGDSKIQPCFVLQYFNHNLERSINRLKKRFIIGIVYEICIAMKYVHEAGIIHRDLKPSNILLDSKYHVKICDFGIMTINSDESHTKGIGTSGFMAPEIEQGRKDYNEKVDVFSFGKILYYLLTKNMNIRQIDEKPTIINDISWELIQKCLSISPEDRPSFSEIIDIIVKNDFNLIDGIENDMLLIGNHLGFQ